MLSLIAKPKFVLVSIVKQGVDPQVFKSELNEAVALVATYGGQVVKVISQNESHFNSGTYIGRGKVAEVAKLIAEEEVDVVVINDNLLASQLYALKTAFIPVKSQIEVWDRTDLILHIFKKHAHTAEAKLQIKLAETRHKGPELQGMGKQMSQQGAGIGTRGMGETNTEIMKRHWRGEIKQIEAALHKLTASRYRQMEHRKRLQLPTLSLIGYTNAGKSTLFNRLTNKKSLIYNAPFATLDSSVAKVYLTKLSKEVFLTDTIGFIQNLPTDLIEAFQSTLMETINADLLLQVIDLSDPFFKDKIITVEKILTDLGIDTTKRLYVFNKIDHPDILNKSALIKDLSSLYPDHQPQFISAINNEGTDKLISAIEKILMTKGSYV